MVFLLMFGAGMVMVGSRGCLRVLNELYDFVVSARQPGWVTLRLIFPHLLGGTPGACHGSLVFLMVAN